jgi:hypothetical protein
VYRGGHKKPATDAFGHTGYCVSFVCPRGVTAMADDTGTEEGLGCSGWFCVEAIVDKTTENAISDDEDENVDDSGLDLVDFVDNSTVIHTKQVHAQALLNKQQAHADQEAVQALKRKLLGSPYESPVSDSQHSIDNELSPRLGGLTLCRGSQGAKRRLFQSLENRDSGYGYSEVEVQQTQVEHGHGAVHGTMGNGGAVGSELGVQENEEGSTTSTPTTRVVELLKCKNLHATLLGKFKELFGVSFGDLVRQFKSDKSSCTDWVIAAFGVNHSIAEGFNTLIKADSLYTHIQWLTCTWGMVLLMLIRFKCGKNRTTVSKGLSKLLNIPTNQLLIEPPRLQSVAAAIYWFRSGISNASIVTGDTPEWIQRQTILEHCFADAQFNLTEMVQWAYDNDITEDSDIAYEYAQRADRDSNAAAFLKSNCQAKYVKDCGVMCRHYKKAQMRRMSMGAWIKHRSAKIGDSGDWKPIVKFIRYQQIDFLAFMSAFKKFLHNIPKKSCLVLIGPPNTGKSQFGMSLINFLAGTVISFVNSHSHFWLQPLDSAKIAMLDDATPPCWTYLDIYLRNLLDGNPCSIDRKHKALTVVKCPPLLITSNTDIRTNDKWKYLYSRVSLFEFPNPFPLDTNGNPVYELNDKNWKSFFQRLWSSLEFQESEDEEDYGETGQTFRCVPGTVVRTV